MDTSFFDAVPQEVLETLSDLRYTIETIEKDHEVNLLLEKTVLVGGKRLRPLLTLLVGQLFQVPLNRLAPYARLIELLHAASLAHDDVIDNATLRRGKDSINVVSSNKKAVLSGDFLFAEVIVSAAKEGNLELVKEVADVIQQLSDGEWLQLKIAEDREFSNDLVESVALKKTASVLKWCSIVGAYLSELPADIKTEMIDLSRNFGEHLGLAFQLVDDTLDFQVTSQKDFMIDEENGLLNAVMVEWLMLDKNAYEQFKNGENVIPDLTSSKFAEALQKSKTRAEHHLKQAHKILNQITKKLEKEFSVTLDQTHKPLSMILEFLSKREY